MVDYRTFRNDDSPGLVRVWNAAFTGRGAILFASSTPLEEYVFAKPYFDPAGLKVAVRDGQIVGWAHAGFGPNSNESELSSEIGILCLLVVHPAHQRQGIGSELLRMSEIYLRERGAKQVIAGPMRPRNPFYLGLYGGSDAPGFLQSDAAAKPFFLRHAYQAAEEMLVLQRTLKSEPKVIDRRFPEMRRRYEVQIGTRKGITTWWQECVLGPLDLLEFRLIEKATGKIVAQAATWEMEGFSQRWGETAVGIVRVEARLELRRRGLVKFLLTHLLHHMGEQYFCTLAEVQTLSTNESAVKLFRYLGFQQVDVGYTYTKESLVIGH